MQRISAQDHGSEILHSEGPFEVANFEHFGLERPFNMAVMIVFTPKSPSEGDISRLDNLDSDLDLKSTVTFLHAVKMDQSQSFVVIKSEAVKLKRMCSVWARPNRTQK